MRIYSFTTSPAAGQIIPWYPFTGKAVPFLEYSVAHSSVLTILAISFERFLAIIYPLKAHYVSSRVRSIIMIIFIWIIAFLSSIPFAYMAEYTYSLHEGTGRNETVCQNRINSPLKQIYLFSTSAIFFAIPFYILCVLYAFISHHLIRDSYKSLGVATDSSAYNLKARRSAVLMLATVVSSSRRRPSLVPVPTCADWWAWCNLDDWKQTSVVFVIERPL